MPTQTFLNLPNGKQDRIINAAVKEFATRRFSEAKLSNIIKEAQIQGVVSINILQTRWIFINMFSTSSVNEN